MGPERFVRRRNYLGVIGKAKIIVGAEINDRFWLATITNDGAGVSGGHQFWLIQIRRPRANSHPIRETWRSLKRIVGLAREEIAKAEFCWVLVHTERSLDPFEPGLGRVTRDALAEFSPSIIPQNVPLNIDR